MTDATGKEAVPEPELRGLLDRLEALWVATDPELPSLLAPGLSPAELDALTAPLGIVLPAAVKTWYGWHNGTAVVGWMYQIGASPVEFLSMSQAIDDYHLMLSWATEYQEGRTLKQAGFDPQWLPIGKTPHGATIAGDCAPRAPTYAAVCIADLADASTQPATDTIADMVRLWLHAHDEGYCYWDQDKRRWDWHLEMYGQRAVPPWAEQRTNGIV